MRAGEIPGLTAEQFFLGGFHCLQRPVEDENVTGHQCLILAGVIDGLFPPAQGLHFHLTGKPPSHTGAAKPLWEASSLANSEHPRHQTTIGKPRITCQHPCLERLNPRRLSCG